MGETMRTGAKTSAAMDSAVLTTIKTIIKTDSAVTGSAVTITETITEIIEMTDSAVTTAEIIEIIEMMDSAVITTEMTGSVRAADPDRDLMAAATIKEDLATRVPRAALCQKVRLRMPRSIEMRKSAASVRRKISGTAKI